MNAAESIIQRERKASMDVIKKCSEESCKEGYEKEWHHSSHEVLQQNRINTYVYGDADHYGEIFSHAAVGNSEI